MLNNRLLSLFLVLIIGVVAIVGLLLSMGQMAAKNESSQIKPAQEPVESPAPIATAANDNETIATVNQEIITRQLWQQVTRLDMVMSQLASQPLPTAEETLDRLVNEIIVLEAVSNIPAPTAEVIEARISALLSAWQVTEERLAVALNDVGLERDDLTARISRLIQVEAALDQLQAKEADLNGWLAQARASAEIGLYHSLVSAAQANTETQASDSATVQEDPGAGAVGQAVLDQTSFTPPADLPISPYPDNAAPDFTLPQLDAGPLTLSQLRGKPVIINFWASWCPPCRRELPALQAAYLAYRDKIGFVAVDVKEDTAVVAAFAKELNLTFPIVFDQDGAISDLAYEVRGLPTTLFIDSRGVVVARHIGPLDEASIDQYLLPLLEPPLASSDLSQPGENQRASSNNQSIPVDSQATDLQLSADLPTAPNFTTMAADGRLVSLQDYAGQKNVVLVFYRGYT